MYSFLHHKVLYPSYPDPVPSHSQPHPPKEAPWALRGWVSMHGLRSVFLHSSSLQPVSVKTILQNKGEIGVFPDKQTLSSLKVPGPALQRSELFSSVKDTEP